MTNNKLTDNEIIKAFECCCKSSHFGECFKNQCPLVSENGCKVGEETLYPYLLDLINRPQAQNKDLSEMVHNLTLEKDGLFDKAEELKVEVERLKEKKSKLKNKIDEIYPLVMQLPNAMQQTKAEAVKEFAERLKHSFFDNGYESPDVDFDYFVDNLVKEMAGEEK